MVIDTRSATAAPVWSVLVGLGVVLPDGVPLGEGVVLVGVVFGSLLPSLKVSGRMQFNSTAMLPSSEGKARRTGQMLVAAKAQFVSFPLSLLGAAPCMKKTGSEELYSRAIHFQWLVFTQLFHRTYASCDLLDEIPSKDVAIWSMQLCGRFGAGPQVWSISPPALNRSEMHWSDSIPPHPAPACEELPLAASVMLADRPDQTL